MHGAAITRPYKRRKTNVVQSSSDVSSAFEDEDAIESETQEESQSSPTEASDAQEDSGDARRKQKYRIHVPKTHEMPADAFFTQPSSANNQAHMIEAFRWRKHNQNIARTDETTPTSEQEHASGQYDKEPYYAATQQLSLAQHVDRSGLATTDSFEDKRSLPQTEIIYDDMLADLPSDAFSSPSSSPEPATRAVPVSNASGPRSATTSFESRSVPSQNRMRQVTLFGTQIARSDTTTAAKQRRSWPMANKSEPVTHHKIDENAMQHWIYPINLGEIRAYQYSIVSRGLYHNILVALPTGLGKTFIAATIMLNWFNWTPNSQIVFVAPTKPLVSQQVKACFGIAGIPRSQTTMLTGNTSPGLRAQEWAKKRVFFMTPQTLVNDLKTGIADPKKIVLLVIDEAHRATGGYAYVEVVKFIRRFNESFRVLALTATPGASIESVQEVIDGLSISRVEIRTEESLDIRQYVHPRTIETELFSYSEEIEMIMDLFSKALQPSVNKLNGMNAYWTRDPMTLTPFGCTQARQKWLMSDAGRKAAPSLKGMIIGLFAMLASLSHATELLKFHGIGPFYHKINAFEHELSENGKKGGKEAKSIVANPSFQTMVTRIRAWIKAPGFLGHPKLERLQELAYDHFLNAQERGHDGSLANTRIMIFAHYRDSAEEIVKVLSSGSTIIKPHVFVGQANTKGSEGMDQKAQLDIIAKFKAGTINTLVATSIGEEGLDIGEVDLIICYDASSSPIRMLQRMGRTGRKRQGNIVVMLMRGKEENNFIKAKDNYEKMQIEIASGARFNFHDDQNRRIVPRHIQPVVEKRIVDIPIENSQADLPEPTKSGKAVKRPPKKFHMPDGVRNGFVKASRMADDEEEDEVSSLLEDVSTVVPFEPAPVPLMLPALEECLLSDIQQQYLEKTYLDVTGNVSETIDLPRVDAFPNLQRVSRSTKHVPHSKISMGMISMLAGVRDGAYLPTLCDERYLEAGDKHAIDTHVEAFHSLQAERSRALSKALPELPPSSCLSASTANESRETRFSTTCLHHGNLGQSHYRSSLRGSSPLEDDLPDLSTLVNHRKSSCLENEAPSRRTRHKFIEDDSDDE